MHVEAGGMDVVGGRHMAELHAGVRLVWRLVLGEPRVALDPKERSADFAGIRHKVRRDLDQALGELIDEVERRLSHVRLVPILVGMEPVPFVVGGEFGKEDERALGKGRGHRGKVPRVRAVGRGR